MKSKLGVYNRYAFLLGFVMALGPLTALSLGSTGGPAPSPRAADGYTGPLSAHDSKRGVAAEHRGKRLYDVAAGSGSLDLFHSLVKSADVQTMMTGDRQYTVFMPVNDAFAELGSDALRALRADSDASGAMVRAHTVTGRVTATDLMSGADLRAIGGNVIRVDSGQGLTVNGAEILYSEATGNGIVHYVDRLL